MKNLVILLTCIACFLYATAIWYFFIKPRGLSFLKFWKHLFSMYIAIMIALFSWPVRAIMNKCGRKTDIYSWLNRYFPLPD